MKTFLFVLLTIFATHSFATSLSNEEIFKKLSEQTQLNLEQKISFWAENFVGLPYGENGPLGEGLSGKFDKDPLYRFDTFDCTTFVETVISLAKSSNKEQFESVIKLIRYQDAQVSYVTRNHITSMLWIPNNIQAGFFTEQTNNFPVPFQRTAKGLMDYPNWLRHHTAERLKVPGASEEEKRDLLDELTYLSYSFSAREVELPYLSINELLGNWEEFSEQVSGIHVLNIVRPNWQLRHLIGTNIHISHQGFLFKKDGQLKFVHASASGKVMESDLREYLAKYKDHKTVKGINLLSPL